MRTSMNGFSNQTDGQLISRVSSEVSEAQSLINTLTSKAEHMSEFLRFAIEKIKETEQVNTADAKALKQASTKESLLGSLAQSVTETVKKIASVFEHIASTITHTKPLWLLLAPIPTLLAAVAKELKLKIEGTDIKSRLGTLTNDNQVNFLLGKMQVHQENRNGQGINWNKSFMPLMRLGVAKLLIACMQNMGIEPTWRGLMRRLSLKEKSFKS